MNQSTSRFLVSKDTIVEACEKAIAAVNAERNRLLEEEIAHQMRPRRWRRPPTREEAKKMAMDAYSGTWTRPPWTIMWWGDLENAQRLLKASRATGMTEAMLDLNDAAFVGEWIERGKT